MLLEVKGAGLDAVTALCWGLFQSTGHPLHMRRWYDMSSMLKRHLHSLDSYRLLVPKLLWEAVPEHSAASSVSRSGQVPSVSLYLCLRYGPWFKYITFFVGQSPANGRN